MRRAPIAPLPAGDTPGLARLADVLGRVLGFLVPLFETAMVRVEAGLTLTPSGGSGTTLLSTSHVVDWNDSGADEWRITGYGVDTSSIAASLHYVVNGVLLASVELPQGSAGVFAGTWNRISTAQRKLIADDQTGHLVAIGDGSHGITLKAVTVQARTVSRVV